MKAIIACLFLAAIAFAAEPATDYAGIFTQTELQELNELQETKWGSIFMALAEVQAEAGPIQRLVQSLDDLNKELETTLRDEIKRYKQKKATHLANVGAINTQINAANQEVTANKIKINSNLKPQINQANAEIRNDKKTIGKKNKALASAKQQRAQQKKEHDKRVQEHNQAIAAADQCINLVSGLLKKKAALIEIKEATLSIRQLEVKIRTSHVTETPFIEALIALVSSQNFANQETTNRVLSLLQDFRSRLTKSLTLEKSNEAASIAAYKALKIQTRKEISELKARINQNTKLIADCEKQIEDCNNIITIKVHEILELKNKLQIENETFRIETNTHKDLKKEILKEIGVVKKCRALFAGRKFSNYINKKIKQIDVK